MHNLVNISHIDSTPLMQCYTVIRGEDWGIKAETIASETRGDIQASVYAFLLPQWKREEVQTSQLTPEKISERKGINSDV